ncbi:Leucine-rich repeat-containing protein 51, partial [Nowakowskiella sp. JEL0078]
PDEVSWIDLSFNRIVKIDESLLNNKNIHSLYLHANNISSFSDIDKLSKLKSLHSLTLHGNPVENISGYRLYVIAKIPQLRNLDFSLITKRDRESAKCLAVDKGKRRRVIEVKDK